MSLSSNFIVIFHFTHVLTLSVWLNLVRDDVLIILVEKFQCSTKTSISSSGMDIASSIYPDDCENKQQVADFGQKSCSKAGSSGSELGH